MGLYELKEVRPLPLRSVEGVMFTSLPPLVPDSSPTPSTVSVLVAVLVCRATVSLLVMVPVCTATVSVLVAVLPVCTPVLYGKGVVTVGREYDEKAVGGRVVEEVAVAVTEVVVSVTDAIETATVDIAARGGEFTVDAFRCIRTGDWDLFMTTGEMERDIRRITLYCELLSTTSLSFFFSFSFSLSLGLIEAVLGRMWCVMVS